MSGFNELSYHSKKYIDDKSGGDSSKTAGGATNTTANTVNKQTMTSIIAACCVLLLISAIAILGQSNKSVSAASIWAGSYKTAGCDVARCCCAKNLNARETGTNKVLLSGKLDGACQRGVTELAITKPLLDQGTMIKHNVLDFTVTYELRGGAIVWTNDDAPECNGYAWPTTEAKDSLSRVYYKRKASLWIGDYVASSSKTSKPGKQCCVPEAISISQTSNDYGLRISITKQSAGNVSSKDAGTCNFRAEGNVHTLSSLVPRGNDMEFVADGQRFRLSLDGTFVVLYDTDPNKKECNGVNFSKLN